MRIPRGFNAYIFLGIDRLATERSVLKDYGQREKLLVGMGQGIGRLHARCFITAERAVAIDIAVVSSLATRSLFTQLYLGEEVPKVIRRVRKKSTFRNRGSQKVPSATKQAIAHNRLSGKVARGG